MTYAERAKLKRSMSPLGAHARPDGQVLVEGQFDACIYDTQCSTRGQRSRNDTVCSDGVENLRVVTTFDGCERAAGPRLGRMRWMR